MLVSDSAT